MYDYPKKIREDIRQYIEENIDISAYEDLKDLEEVLNDELWTTDSVTGNASGSYTFNRWTAQEYVIDNLDTLQEATEEFGIGTDEIGKKFLSGDFEFFDVLIRCYLLPGCIAEVIAELEQESPAA